MTERMEKGIRGAISGAGTGLFMEVLRGSGYIDGVSITVKAVRAGVIAGIIYMTITAIVRLVRPEATSKVS